MQPGDISAAGAELTLAIACMGALMIGTFRPDEKMAGLLTYAMALLLATLGAVVATQTGRETAFGGAFVSDGYARFAKTLLLFASAATLALAKEYMARRDLLKFEFPVLIGFAVLGMMVMVSAGDLMALYMGLELQSLALYVIAAFRRDSLKSTEAGLKYFVLGALSSGLLLYGASLVYGFAGATGFAAIREVVAAEGLSYGLLAGVAFMAAGLAFKVSAAPFHMWTPDVYEGSPTPVTAFFSTAPKVAASALFARVMFDAFGDATGEWRQIIVFVSLMSMFWGAFAAIGQRNLKRLMAYSSIGHMGFALLGLAAGTERGVAALLVYLAVYVVMNLGVFAYLLRMERDGRPVVEISDLAGLANQAPAQAMAVAALLFSLAGIPPLLGFFPKYFVFAAAVDAGLAPVAVAGVIAALIGAFYYLRIVKIMYFDPLDAPLDRRMPLLNGLALTVSALAMAVGWLPFLGGFGVTEFGAQAAEALFR